MRFARISGEVWKGSLRACTVGMLCVLMVDQPMLAAPPSAAKSAAKRATQIQNDERALHVLNRFTFGPRPGDLAAVQAMGVKRWFQQQLNPARIDDSALDARLATFPAMQLPQVELMQRYPSPQMLRQIIAKGLPLPADPVEHAIYSDQIAFYLAAKEKREAKAAAAGKETASTADDGMQIEKAPDAMNGKAALPGDGVDPSTPAMETHEEQLYAGLDAVRIINLPPEQRMQRILGMQPDELIAFRRSLSKSELAAAGEGLTPEQKETLQALQGSPRVIDAELLESRMLRDIYSERQLQAVMADFWLNHFNVYIRKNQNEPYLLSSYERDVIRPHALGKFEDLLVATAQSPAMLMYLDNWQSIGPDSIAAENAARNAGRNALRVDNPQAKKAAKDHGLNENYARELMELHTIGVQCEVSEDHPARSLDKACGKGYTQQDVIEVAKVLSGWTIDRPNEGAEFRFELRRHEPGTKVVMGKTIRENGQGEGLELLHMLATSPATAKMISTQLAIRFVSDTPPPALVAHMAKAYMKSDGDIKTVLWTMFNSPEFWSPEVYRAKVKTPLEFVTSAVRASGAEVANAAPLVQALNKLGMPLYGMQTPNGYSWMAEPWVNTGDLVSRMNFALVLTSNRLPGVQTDWTQLLGEPAVGIRPASLNTEGRDTLVADKEKKLETLLLGQPVSDHTRDTVLAQFENQETQAQAMKNFAIKPTEQEIMSGVLNAGAPKQAPRPRLDQQAAGMAGLLIGSPEFQRR
jgi:uncharacterized protein (DUF1800 family)